MTENIPWQSLRTDVLVIGAGGAGARAAVEAARMGSRVTLVCRSPLGKGGLTPTANGGYHAAVWPGDSPSIHAEDLIGMGCNLNDRNLVDALCQEAPEQAMVLEKFGVRINRDIPPKPHEPQMRYPRSLFVPGRDILAGLKRQLKASSDVLLLEDHLALELLTSGGAVTGALLFNIKEGCFAVCTGKATILASGSLGEIYSRSAQEPMGLPTGSAGSGYVLAGRAGADLVDMEMVQFAAVPLSPPLIEGMRSLPWAPLANAEGREFLPLQAGEYSHEAARAIYREISEGRGPVTMHLPDRKPSSGAARNPLFGKRMDILRKYGATPFQRPITVGVGALYMMGGVHINERCETTIPGLYAAGEVTGNVHGARRVSGNAFPEIIVFGARAGKYAALEAGRAGASHEAPRQQIREALAYVSRLLEKGPGDLTAGELRHEIRRIMDQQANLIRTGPGLAGALEELGKLEQALPSVKIGPLPDLRFNAPLLEAFDVRWLLGAARLVCRAAALRKESRGFHFREDFPEERASWLKHTVLRREGEGWSEGTKPVVM